LILGRLEFETTLVLYLCPAKLLEFVERGNLGILNTILCEMGVIYCVQRGNVGLNYIFIIYFKDFDLSNIVKYQIEVVLKNIILPFSYSLTLF
jgi:hypothetical protein